MRLFTDDLAKLPLFSSVSRSELALIRRQLTMVPVAAGRVLVREGARGDEFMIIAEGEATVTQGGHVIATLGRGDLVGEMALLNEDGFGRRNANSDRHDRRHGLRRVASGVSPDPRSSSRRGPQSASNGGRPHARPGRLRTGGVRCADFANRTHISSSERLAVEYAWMLNRLGPLCASGRKAHRRQPGFQLAVGSTTVEGN